MRLRETCSRRTCLHLSRMPKPSGRYICLRITGILCYEPAILATEYGFHAPTGIRAATREYGCSFGRLLCRVGSGRIHRQRPSHRRMALKLGFHVILLGSELDNAMRGSTLLIGVLESHRPASRIGVDLNQYETGHDPVHCPPSHVYDQSQ